MKSRTGLLMAAMAATASAATTTTWEMNSYNDFLRGRFSNVSLSRSGRLSLAPKLETLFASEQPEIWSISRGPDGSLYLGTGHRGRVYRVDPDGRGALLWTAEQPEVFALAVDARGVLYAGTSPNGRVYRIENGKAAEFFNPESRYIWSLQFASDGSLFVGTGDRGKIFRVQPDGRGEVYYESGQTHITALAMDGQGRLLAGSEPNGILYRIEGPKRAFVLYDAGLPEIRAILPRPDGTIYASALGGAVARRSGTVYGTGGAAGTPMVTAPAISVTVTDSDAQAGPEVNPPKPEPAKPQAPVPQAPAAQTAPAYDLSGLVEKSAIYRIHADHTIETVWSSKDENVYDIAFESDRLLFSTDLQGRIYGLSPDRTATLIAQTNEAEAMRLMPSPAGLLATTGNMGKLYRLTGSPAPDGYFEAPVHDANTVARWGRLSWRANTPPGTQVAFRTRTGNSARPDNTWSDWSAPITDPAKGPIQSPNARYIQWRVEFRSSSGASPSVSSVSAAYLPQNTPPVVRSISVSSLAGQPQQRTQGAAGASGNAAFSITVTDTGETPQTPAGTPTQTLNRGAGQQIQIVWQADDPDNDRLVYTLYFRGEDESEWKVLRTNLFENTFTVDGDALADGRYFFRVAASDRPANPLEYARDAELISAPVLIDNTPPVVRIGGVQRTADAVQIPVEAVDQTSALRRCEYSVDAGPWYPVEADDGVTDSPSERFRIRLENLRPGEHLVTVRVFDSAGNAGLGKVVLR